MKVYMQKTLKLIYVFVEQFVFYFAAIVAFFCWVYFGNIYVTALIFILICTLFWILPKAFKRKVKRAKFDLEH